MKIKTIATTDPGKFDHQVNTMLDDGYVLGKRELVQTPAGTKDYFYAELVLLDPAPEPDQVAGCNPLNLVAQLREFCDGIPKKVCENGECPLSRICAKMADGKAIDEWGRTAEVTHG